MPNPNGIRIIAAIQVTLIVLLVGLSAYSLGATIYHIFNLDSIGIIIGLISFGLTSIAAFYLSRFYTDFKEMYM